MNLRELERESIRAFVQSAADEGYLSGRVLDFGCGRQPYREIVETAGGEYLGFDSPRFPASTTSELHVPDWPHAYDATLCTQVLQYVPNPMTALHQIGNGLRPIYHGADREKARHLVMTYPTNWPEVEPEDLHRFTKAGMERLLTEAGFTIIRHEERAEVVGAVRVPNGLLTTGDAFALGYGVIAQA